MVHPLTAQRSGSDTAALARIFWYNVPHRCLGITAQQATLAQSFQHNQGFQQKLHAGFKTATLIMHSMLLPHVIWAPVRLQTALLANTIQQNSTSSSCSPFSTALRQIRLASMHDYSYFVYLLYILNNIPSLIVLRCSWSMVVCCKIMQH